MSKLLVMLVGTMAFSWCWAEGSEVKEVVKSAESVRTTVKLAYQPVDEADLAAYCVPTNAKFVVCIVRGADRLNYAIYARTQPEGAPAWTKLEGLTPLVDAENELTVEYDHATKTVKVVGATNSATFYSLNPKSAYQSKTTFVGEAKP